MMTGSGHSIVKSHHAFISAANTYDAILVNEELAEIPLDVAAEEAALLRFEVLVEGRFVLACDEGMVQMEGEGFSIDCFGGRSIGRTHKGAG